MKYALILHEGKLKREGGYGMLTRTQAKVFSQKEKNIG